MIDFQMRPTPALVRQIAAIERLAGRWDRISQSLAVASNPLFERAILRGSHAAFSLDQTTPPALLLIVDRVDAPTVVKHGHSEGQAELISHFLAAHKQPPQAGIDGLNALYLEITGEPDADGASLFRRMPMNFLSPLEGVFPEKVVFPTVSPFLIEQRMQELLSWVNAELQRGPYHPLIVLGTFHLLFLQIHPYPTANHRLAMLLLWHLLRKSGYEFVGYSHFAPFLAEHPTEYYTALRQAERTARGNWSTLNIWLELFLQSLNAAADRLVHFSERRLATERLTGVQKRILDIVKLHGPITREKIVKHTGLNLSTVKYNLGILSEKGHLKRHGGGRTTSYRML